MSPRGRNSKIRPAVALAMSVISLLALAATAAPASAERTVAKATSKVHKWQSPRTYDSPYALVKVIQDGKAIAKSPVSRCKGAYVSKDIAVMISTCGHRWRVKASYVSMSGHKERFEIVYEPRNGA